MILIRHCKAKGDIRQIFQGHTDTPTAEDGRRQLGLLALHLRNTKTDVLHSSPLVRAYGATVAINQYHSLPILRGRGLMELDGGEWEGIPQTGLPEGFPGMAGIWWTAPHEFVSEQGEGMRQIYDRIWDTMMRLVQENSGKAIAVTSHGCATRSFLCRVARWPIEQLNDMDRSGNTAVSIVDFDEGRNVIIRLKNGASHLAGEPICAAPRNWTRKD